MFRLRERAQGLRSKYSGFGLRARLKGFKFKAVESIAESTKPNTHDCL